ncbi:MAG: UDP-N-acetylmuramate dehydrogenase [Erysipelothrix sp.]|nr:UDP-N-acetylmuramate dehydrogenase [Erysipelothrix sp.]
MPYFVLKDTSLKRFHTFQLDVMASIVVIPTDKNGLISALRDYSGRRIVLIGKGSNMIFSQSSYDEHTVFIVTTMVDLMELSDNLIHVDAGTTMNALAWFTCEHSIDGYAFCEDIPGTLGGALMMNAGQWRYTIGQYVKWIEVFDYDTQEVKIIYPDEKFFSYRYSQLNDMNVCVLEVALSIQPGEYMEILDLMLQYRRERYVKQPRQYANAGSVFKRPKDKEGNALFTWKLFDACDLRGFQIGDAQVSEKHPGFIVNKGNAKVADVHMVIEECKKRVKETFDVDLELEWRVI